MNTDVKNITLPKNIFDTVSDTFSQTALEVFHFQYTNNEVYRQYCNTLYIDPAAITTIEKIPFLPISFFKTHRITTTQFDPEIIFESSGTTQTINSKHLIKELSVYETSFNKTFNQFYGNPAEWCIVALLPSYLERNNSSLVMMADQLIRQTNHPLSGFYIDDFKKLNETIHQLEQQQQKTLLIGVTFALLDFAEKYPQPLQFTTIMETGGMKGRRTELIRSEVHDILCNSFQLNKIHSEYGMTELLSQAYSSGNGIYSCPPWMKILIREEDDPFAILTAADNNPISGALNIIDLANMYSCAFIATEDAGKLYPDESFEVSGRLDNTDIRGCSLLSL